MFSRVLIIVITLLIFGCLVSALDDEGNPNDPTVNDRANACYEDGSMAGKCDTEWEWNCGWYIIRFEYGIFERANVIATCASLLPPEDVVTMLPESETELVTPSANCLRVNDIPQSVDFGGGYFLPIGSNVVYNSADCSGPLSAPSTFNLVYAPAPHDALELCNLNGSFTSTAAVFQNDVNTCFN